MKEIDKRKVLAWAIIAFVVLGLTVTISYPRGERKLNLKCVALYGMSKFRQAVSNNDKINVSFDPAECKK